MKEAPYGTVLVKTGTHGFSTKLVESGLISRHDVAVAEQHALREQLHLVDAVVALGFVRETDSYAALAASLGTETVNLAETPSSELAIRLVPERLARRHCVVPLTVDNRLLTFATVNMDSARRSKVQLSAQLLRLATLVTSK